MTSSEPLPLSGLLFEKKGHRIVIPDDIDAATVKRLREAGIPINETRSKGRVRYSDGGNNLQNFIHQGGILWERNALQHAALSRYDDSPELKWRTFMPGVKQNLTGKLIPLGIIYRLTGENNRDVAITDPLSLEAFTKSGGRTPETPRRAPAFTRWP